MLKENLIVKIPDRKKETSPLKIPDKTTNKLKVAYIGKFLTN